MSTETKKYTASLRSEHSSYKKYFDYIFEWNFSSSSNNLFLEDPNIIYTNIKFFRIISFNNETLTIMYQDNFGKEVGISIVSHCTKYQFGGTRRSTYNLTPKRCRLWPDFSCATIKLPPDLHSNSSMNNMVNCFFVFYQVRKYLHSNFQTLIW